MKKIHVLTLISTLLSSSVFADKVQECKANCPEGTKCVAKQEAKVEKADSEQEENVKPARKGHRVNGHGLLQKYEDQWKNKK
ncbi:MAG: hypothetical protein MJ218_01410 [Opitutales bacterium]|nr:hypothetical protein [Opitutales bacterium]